MMSILARKGFPAGNALAERGALKNKPSEVVTALCVGFA